MAKPRIAHLAGPNATIQNTPPLVTSNKARARHGLPPMTDGDGSPVRFDALRAQRLAAPATVYVEQFSAHPLERDAAELYAPPDGYLDAAGEFSEERRNPDDKPVYRIELSPEDGLYPLPYMARQADGSAWEDDGTHPGAPAERSRQAYFPDGSRLFEEVDRLGVSMAGHASMISSLAEIEFHRIVPSGGYTKGLPAGERTDIGEGDIPPEVLGRDFFPYRPTHLASAPPRPALAEIANRAQEILSSGDYIGAIFSQGSPRIEETIYWLQLLLDTTLPVCGNAAQRTMGEISNDGPKNLHDSVQYLTSRVWADADGRNRAGMVLIQEQQIFSARDVQKGDARPGGYVTTGGHGGILGGIPHDAPPLLTYLPSVRHSHGSAVNLTRLPDEVEGSLVRNGRRDAVTVPVKERDGSLRGDALPRVSIVKDGNFHADRANADPGDEADLNAAMADRLANAPLAGFVVEGQSPYGSMTAPARHRLMQRAAFSGMPVARVGRGNNDGFTAGTDVFIGGGNLTATKARLLLIACMLKLGAMPAAADPDAPTADERAALAARVAEYQEVFSSH